MEMLVFATKVQHAVREALGEEYRVELKEVRKNNGVILQGLVIRRGEDNIMPTIYLNSFLKAYEQGITFADIIRKIVSVYRDDAVGKEIDISFFCDFRLINKAKNKELLEKAPFIPILDLAACFYYACEEGGVINGVIPVYHSHLEVWGVTDRELFECAVKNTPKLFPCEIMPMKSALREMLQELEEMGEDIAGKLDQIIPMMILTNSKKTYGACCIMYPKVLERLAGSVGGDYVLSDSLYLYSCKERCVKIL